MISRFVKQFAFTVLSLLTTTAFADVSETEQTLACHNALVKNFSDALPNYQVYSNHSVLPNDKAWVAKDENKKAADLVFSWDRMDYRIEDPDEKANRPKTPNMSRVRWNFADKENAYYAFSYIPDKEFYDKPHSLRLVFPPPLSQTYCFKFKMVFMWGMRDAFTQFEPATPGKCDDYKEIKVKAATDPGQKNFALDQIQGNMAKSLGVRISNVEDLKKKTEVSSASAENAKSLKNFPTSSCANLDNEQLKARIEKIRELQKTTPASGIPERIEPAQK